MRDIEQVCPEQAHDFLLIVVVDNFAQVKIIFLISHLASTLNSSLMNLGKNEAN